MILRSNRSARAHRGGFTLLEILLASLLAALVLAAVYMLLNVTLQQTQSSRDAVEVEDVTRGVFNKMNIDLSGTLAPLPPKSGGNSAASGGPTSSPTTPTSPTSPTSPSGTPTSSGTPAGTGSTTPTTPTSGTTTPTDGSSEPGATDNATANAADYAFQGGVIGDEKKLVIYAGKVPEAFGRYRNPDEQVKADQRQIIYWLGSNGGLYRRERPWVTADGVRNAIQNDEEALDSALVAEEVTNLTFEYFDGSGWVSTWDGTSPGPDGVTPLGPPRAIKVTLELKIPVSRGEPLTKTVSQVIVVRSAPGTYTPPLLTAPTDAGTDGSSTPSTPSSGMGSTPSSPSGSGSMPGGSSPSGSSPGGNSGKGSTPSMPSSPSSPSMPSTPSGGTKTGSPGSGSGSKGGGR